MQTPKWNTKKSFEVRTTQVLDENGNLTGKLPSLATIDIKKLYSYMVLARVFDEKLLSLQRQGRLGTFAQIRGQEASNVGIGYALGKDDWFFPSFRELGTSIVLGLPMENIIEYFSGDERGSQMPKNLNHFPINIPVSTQIPHAVGMAWANKLKKKNVAVLVAFGDGATSKGDFHEGLNLAGVFKLPIVFFCQNNQWAISMPMEKQSAAETLAQKAIAYGFEGVQVDGNDVFAVYSETKKAIEKARNGGGPTLIEAYTYRMGDHTTSDDAAKYRPQKDVEEWRKKDPTERLRKFMVAKKIWKKSEEKKLLKSCEKQVEFAVKKAENLKPQSTEDIFKYMYAEMTPELKRQLEKIKEEL